MHSFSLRGCKTAGGKILEVKRMQLAQERNCLGTIQILRNHVGGWGRPNDYVIT